MTQNTSINAYNTIKGNGLLGKLQFEVYDVIVHYGPITQGETWSVHFQDRQRHDIGPRFAELEKKGVIARIGERACGYTGVDSYIYVATENLPIKLPKAKTKNQIIEALTDKVARLEQQIQKLLQGNHGNNDN
jgi:hypothetical protein